MVLASTCEYIASYPRNRKAGGLQKSVRFWCQVERTLSPRDIESLFSVTSTLRQKTPNEENVRSYKNSVNFYKTIRRQGSEDDSLHYKVHHTSFANNDLHFEIVNTVHRSTLQLHLLHSHNANQQQQRDPVRTMDQYIECLYTEPQHPAIVKQTIGEDILQNRCLQVMRSEVS